MRGAQVRRVQLSKQVRDEQGKGQQTPPGVSRVSSAAPERENQNPRTAQSTQKIRAGSVTSAFS